MLEPLTTTKVSGREGWPPVAPLPAPKYPLVMTITGGYQVDLGPSGLRRAPRFHLVLKDRTCNCSAVNCPGVQEVEKYLKAGGVRAPDGSALKSLTGPCPICQGATRAVGGSWECLGNSTHYFEFRITRLRAAREGWLNRLPPEAAEYHAEINATFASEETRTTFVQAHALTYPAGS